MTGCFYLAKVNEKPEILLPMAMGRLIWPWDLGSQAEEEYLEYVKETCAGMRFFIIWNRKDWNQAFFLSGTAKAVGQRKLWIR